MAKKKMKRAMLPSQMLNIVNPALPYADPARIYSGVQAQLNITLLNTTGDDISFQAGTTMMEVYLPSYFAASEVHAIAVTNLPEGWTAAYNKTDDAFIINWSGTDGEWADGDTLTFTLSNVATAATQGSDDLQINFTAFNGQNMPSFTTSLLVLSSQPQPGNASLRDMIDVSLQYGETVYVSTPGNLLSNALRINFRHKTQDGPPLFSGSNHWQGNPQVFVTFVYGSNSGSLADSDKSQSTQAGSAWQIAGKVFVDETGGWNVTNPQVTDGSHVPVWTLTPTQANTEIIGTGDQSNVTFEFDQIVSLTPQGMTQVYVHFSGFMQDDHTPYNDETFVLSLEKSSAPVAGAINIWSIPDQLVVLSSSQQIQAPLTWSMLMVGSVKLTFSLHDETILEQYFPYSNAHPVLNYDTESVQLPTIQSGGMLTIYCTAYSDDSYGNELNKVQCSVPVVFVPVINYFNMTYIPSTSPNSYTMRLTWDIDGTDKFEIVEDDGSGSPTTLNVPRNVTTYDVYPTSPTTTYTLNLYPPDNSI